MPFLVAALGKVILFALGTFLYRLIIGLGLGFLAFEGVDSLIGVLQGKMVQAAGASAYFNQAAQVVGLWDALNIIIAAYTARFTTGTVYRFAMRKAV